MKVDLIENMLSSLREKLTWYTPALDNKRKDKKIRWTVYIEEHYIIDAEELGFDKTEIVRKAFHTHNEQGFKAQIKKLENLK